MRRTIVIGLLLAVSLAACVQPCRGDVVVTMRGDDNGFGTGTPVVPGDLVYFPVGPGDPDGFDAPLQGDWGAPDFQWSHSFAQFSSITSAHLYVQSIEFPESGGPEHGAGQLWIDGTRTPLYFPRIPDQEIGPFPVHGITFDVSSYSATLMDGFVAFAIDVWDDDAYAIDYAVLTIEGTVAPPQWRLTTSSTTGGTVSTPGVGVFEYDHATSVPVVAVPAANYHFVNWTGTAVDAGRVGDPALASTTVTMDADYTLQANFAIDQWTLTLSSTAGGTVATPGEGTFQYDYGTQITLQAEPEPLFEFAGWRGSVFSSQNPLMLTMENDCQVRAQFISVLDMLYVDDDAPGDPGPDDPNLSDPNENGTAEHPFDTLQEAIEVVKDGARVIVRSGTYRETIDLLGKSITVSGLDDDPNDGGLADLPIIDAQGRDAVVKCTQGEDPNCILQGLVITGGKAQVAGGILCVGSSPTVLNCLIVGNLATGLHAGGGIHCQDSNAVFVNCTISGNCGGSAGAGVCLSESNAVLLNSIVWENAPTQVRLLGSGGSIVAYTDVAEGWPATANLDVDPCFALPGYWADPADLTKMLPATNLAGVWVGGDYHLQSQAGRWEPLTKAWVIDAATSPCIDAGDPNTPTGKEPLPNGSRINLGAYGGTPQTSKSP